MSEHSKKIAVKKKVITLKRLKNWTLSLVGLIVIFLAISFTLIRVAIKSIPDYSIAIQQAVSEQMDLTLEVGFMDAEIYWLVPRLNLIDVNVFDKTGKHHLLYLGEIDLSLDWAETIKIMSPVISEITLVGINVQIEINKKSQLLLQNYVINDDIDAALKVAEDGVASEAFEISQEIKSNLNKLNFKVLNSRVSFYDKRYEGKPKEFTNFNLHLINNDDYHVFEVKADLPQKYGEKAHFIVAVEGDLFDYKNLDGDLYLSVQSIDAASWLDDYWSELKVSANANISGQFWLKWSAQNIIDINSQLSISEFALHYLDEEVNTWSVDHLNALIRWKKNDNDWQLDVRNLVVEREGIDWLKPAAATLSLSNNQQDIHLNADFLRIEGFVYLAGMLSSVADLDIAWLNLLDKHKPSGALKNLDVMLPINEPQDIEINTQFSQLGFSFPQSEPSAVSNLQGAIAYRDKKTWLTLDSENTEIKFNELFRNSIYLKKLRGILEISHLNHIWELSTRSLEVSTPHIKTEMRMDFNMPDNGRAFLDLTAQFKDGEVRFANQYLPAGVMGKGALAWVDNALHDGKLTQGGYQFYGYLSDAPFRKNEGVSLAEFDVVGVDVTYLQNWPDVNDVSANLRFENDSVFIAASHATLLDSKSKKTTVYIDNFVSPTLDVRSKIDTQLTNIKQFLNESSLREDVTDYVDNLQFGGAGVLDLELFLPLYGDFYTEVGGELEIKNGSLKFKKEKYELNNVNGLIRFARDTVEAPALKAELKGNEPGQLIDINIQTLSPDSGREYRIGIKGNILASALLAPVPKMQEYFKGSADWDISVDIKNNKVKEETIVGVQVASDLQNVTSTLPGSLAKSSRDKEPVDISINIDSDSMTDYEIKLNDGGKVSLQHKKDKLLILADTKSVKGSMDINLQDEMDIPIQVKLEYIDLNEFFHANESKASTDDVLSDKNIKPVSPRKIPSFDFYADELIWKKSVYRQSVLEVQESKLGAVIKKFKFTGADHEITGKGLWFTGENNQSTTSMDINITVGNLGNVFRSLEISDSLVGAAGNVKLNWEWRDVPYRFDWKILKGDGELSLNDGTLKELNAGAGRLLGLFNFKTLFSLDFGNQVKDGFNFDKVTGSFSFGGGNIYSNDFEVESKIATVFMDGRLSFANNTVDQVVTVRPHLGGTVTIGTAVVAGPAIGGLVYLFQKIFNTDRLSEYQYSMKGNLDNPDVKLISAPVTDQDIFDD